MDLILWRHCEAEPGEPDLGRRLTSKGLKQAERMAGWLDAHLPDSARVLVSPADRAQQTAQALSRKFKTVPELAPGGGVAALLAAANWPDSREPVLVVGHQPTLGLCASFLLSGRGGLVVGAQGRGLVAFQPRQGRRGHRGAQGGPGSGFSLTLCLLLRLRVQGKRSTAPPRAMRQDHRAASA